mgnify:CR=1 FL=1
MTVHFPETKGNIVSILSGGLDSTIMTYALVKKYGRDRVYALSFYYGQKQHVELERARATCKHLTIRHKVLDLSVLGDIVKEVSANIQGSKLDTPTITQVLGDPQPKTYVPFRNMILCSVAFSFAESISATHIFSGLQATDQYNYWDTTQSFVNSVNKVASHNRTHTIELVTPFSNMSKFEELIFSKDLDVRYELTLTCYNPDSQGRSCGICPSCAERIKAFEKANMIDKIEYV